MMYSNSSYGVPQGRVTYLQNVTVNREHLRKLSFTDKQIDVVELFVRNNTPVTLSKLQNRGVSYANAVKIKQAYDICVGRVEVKTVEQYAKHLQKMNKSNGVKIGIQHLPVGKVSKVPKKALVLGIPEGKFEFLNSNNYKGPESLYYVEQVTQTNILIRTKRKPVLEKNDKKGIENVIQVESLKEDGTVIYKVNKNYARVCNSFVIVASFRFPETHLGMAELICFDGTKLYVFAKSIETRTNASTYAGTQRVYMYGNHLKEIAPKLESCIRGLGIHLKAKCVTRYSATQDYGLISREEKPEDEIEII